MQDGQGGDQQWARSVRPFSRSFAEGARLDPIVHAIQSAGSVRRSVGSATMTTPRTDRPARASTRRTDPTPRELQRPVDDRDDLSRGEDQARQSHAYRNEPTRWRRETHPRAVRLADALLGRLDVRRHHLKPDDPGRRLVRL
jgi:hypothetical protein